MLISGVYFFYFNEPSLTGESFIFDKHFTPIRETYSSSNIFSCSDSDKGKNYTLRGRVVVKYHLQKDAKIQTVIRTLEDKCTNTTELEEYYCKGNNYSSLKKSCEYGCEIGKCVTHFINKKPTTGCISKTCSPSLGDVYNDLIKIGGFQAFNYIYSQYDGFSSIADKEKLFNEGFSKHPFKAKLFDFVEFEPYENEKLLVKGIVHMVWIEENKIVPWSIKDYTKSELNSIIYRYVLPYDYSYNFTYEGTTYTNLANPDFLVNGIKGENIFLNAFKLPYLHDAKTGGNNDLINMGGPWGKETFDSARIEAEGYKIFPLSYYLTKNKLDSKYHIVTGITEFLEMNFFHAYANDFCDLQTCGWNVYTKYNYSLFDNTLGEMPVEIFFKERVTGCFPVNYLEIAMLRSLNVPALSILLGDHHATFVVNPEFFVHGDFVAMLTAFPGEYLVMNRTQLQEYKALENYNYYINEYIPQKQTSNSEIKKYNLLFLRKKGNKLYYLYPSSNVKQFNDDAVYYQSKISNYFPFSSWNTDFLKSQELSIKTLDELNAESIN